jgi:type IX secretion system PorP/SprF family membrane protein
MSNPSFSNIDRWLFELVEGNLTPQQEAQLKAFLLMHPELEIDADSWEEAFVTKEQMDFVDKGTLQKRRPLGLYMSLGFSFMVGLVLVGISSQFSELEGSYGKDNLAVTSLADETWGTLTDTSQKVVTSSNAVKSENQFDKNSEFERQGKNDLSTVNNFTNPASDVVAPISDLTITNIFEFQEINGNLSDIDFDLTGNATTKSKLTTQKAKPLQLKSSAEFPTVRSDSYASVDQKKFAKSSYHRSLGTRIHHMGRALERMLDNPIALRNQNDPYYHVPGMQATDINFSAVGTLLTTRIQTITRAQWYGMDNQQWMNQLSVDGYSYAMRGGLGFQLNQNYYGDGSIQNYHAALTYSPKFSVSREVVLEPSIRYKMGSKQLDPTQVQTGQMVEYDRMNDQQFSNSGPNPLGRTLWYRDLGLGLMVNTRWFFAGIQQDNLLRHYDNIYSQDLSDPRRAPKHFVACVGSDYKSVRQKITISPYLIYQKEDQLSEAWAGFNFRFYWLTLGGAISSNFDLASSAGIKLKNFMLQYNVDLTHSSMLNKQLLSHQLTLRFTTKAGRVGQRLLN